MDLVQVVTGEEDAGRWAWLSGALTVEVLHMADGCVVPGLWWRGVLLRMWEEAVLPSGTSGTVGQMVS